MSSQYKNDDTANQAAPDPPPSNTNPVTGERLPKGYIAVFEPNNFIYTDNNGIRHNIHLPGGTYKKAMKYYEEKNWNELAKFPTWENQQYTVHDVILRKADADNESQ